MKNTIKIIKEECELLDESSKIIKIRNFNENNQFNQNNEVLFGLLKNSNINLYHDSNTSNLFSPSATINDDYKPHIKNEPSVLTSTSINKIPISHNDYSIMNNQNYAFSTASPENVTIPNSCNGDFIQYNPDVQFQFGVTPVKMESFTSNQSSSSIFMLNTQLNDPLSQTRVEYSKSDLQSDASDENFKKIERKRERNREAAKKCREKKNSLIEKLQLKLEDQRSQITMMKEKMKLMLIEIKRLSAYISENIPYSNLENFIDENQLNQYLDC